MFYGVAMSLVYYCICNQETAMLQYAFPSDELARGNEQWMSRRVANQAFPQMFFFFIAWIFPMLTFAVSQAAGDLLFPLLALTVIFSPMHGFFNALVYLRPRYLRYQRQRRRSSGPSPSVWHGFREIVNSRPTPTTGNENDDDNDDIVQGEIYDPEDEDREKTTLPSEKETKVDIPKEGGEDSTWPSEAPEAPQPHATVERTIEYQ
jgi:hypothetical protein